MLAKISGIFRLTRDAELKNVGQITICEVSLACSEKYKDKETKLFINGACFGKQAETLCQYAGKKGTQIYIIGKLKTDQWEKDGQKLSKISMTIESFEFIGNKTPNTGDNSGNYSGIPQQPPRQQKQFKNEPVFNTDTFEDDIPF